ncbi:universal stress protein [Brevundimonas lutea]|uniref:universal stress protein n=1 Tax=Brevundimonas lutea TaxID=2293980 RepID=UPI000F03686F|nr:universal stress protein [Brevundimonas lutea]
MPRKFLVVADDTPEFDSALRFAARRARSTGGRVVLLRILSSSDSNAHWSGVRDEIEREQRAEAEALLGKLGARAEEISGATPVLIIETGDTAAAIRKAVAEDVEIKILVLAASSGRNPGPLVQEVARGEGPSGRKLPVTIVPGDLSDDEIEDLA